MRCAVARRPPGSSTGSSARSLLLIWSLVVGPRAQYNACVRGVRQTRTLQHPILRHQLVSALTIECTRSCQEERLTGRSPLACRSSQMASALPRQSPSTNARMRSRTPRSVISGSMYGGVGCVSAYSMAPTKPVKSPALTLCTKLWSSGVGRSPSGHAQKQRARDTEGREKRRARLTAGPARRARRAASPTWSCPKGPPRPTP